MQQVLIQQNLLKKIDLASLKSDVDELDIDKLKTVPSGLSNWKSNVDKLDVDKLVPAPVDLSKLSDVVNNDFVKNTVHDNLVKKANTIKAGDFGNLVRKADYNTKIAEIEKKILYHDHDEYIVTKKLNKLTSII